MATKKKTSKKLFYRFVKRVFDFFVGLFGCICLLPLIIVIKVIYMCSGDFHSIFFVQKRIGKNGKEFNFIKFRTMVLNADEILEKLLKENPKLRKEYEINKKLEKDPRITKIGDFLRRKSVDELPQLINILVGNMSLIGNRPYLPREKKDMGNKFDVIVSTKPGLTGYWQVSGRSDLSFKERLRLEEYYSNNCGFKMDLKIFFKTFKTIFGGKGAK
ncbi:MAG: sugar transferase [Bacilli bacterium]|nr:sugar transferase [Bacilli bacterium]